MKSNYCLYEVKIYDKFGPFVYFLSTFSPQKAVEHVLNNCPHIHERTLITIKKMD